MTCLQGLTVSVEIKGFIDLHWDWPSLSLTFIGIDLHWHVPPA